MNCYLARKTQSKSEVNLLMAFQLRAKFELYLRFS